MHMLYIACFIYIYLNDFSRSYLEFVCKFRTSGTRYVHITRASGSSSRDARDEIKVEFYRGFIVAYRSRAKPKEYLLSDPITRTRAY